MKSLMCWLIGKGRNEETKQNPPQTRVAKVQISRPRATSTSTPSYFSFASDLNTTFRIDAAVLYVVKESGT
jgi:hypothetical protein